MCGIYGYLGNPTRKTKRVVRLLGLYNQSRGTDSSGLAIVKPDDFELYKAVGNTYRFFNQTNALKSVVSAEYLNIIGHTRHATTGKISYNNAHPYNFGDIVYAHNGVIQNHTKLGKELGQDYEVDSQVIGELLETLGERKTFEHKLSGWWAIPYLDISKPWELRLIRHDAPLHVAIRPDRRGMYFTSEASHLKKALRKVRENAPVNKLGENKVYSFKYMDGITYTKTKLNIRKTSQYYGYGGGYSGYNDYEINRAWGGYKHVNGRWQKSGKNWYKVGKVIKDDDVVQQALLTN